MNVSRETSAGLKVTVVDEATGDTETRTVADNDYVLIVSGDCYLANVQSHANGTHVLTIKGRRA